MGHPTLFLEAAIAPFAVRYIVWSSSTGTLTDCLREPSKLNPPPLQFSKKYFIQNVGLPPLNYLSQKEERETSLQRRYQALLKSAVYPGLAQQEIVVDWICVLKTEKLDNWYSLGSAEAQYSRLFPVCCVHGHLWDDDY